MSRKIALDQCVCGGEAKLYCSRVAEDAEECWAECVRCGRMTEPVEDAYCDYAQATDDWQRGKATLPAA